MVVVTWLSKSPFGESVSGKFLLKTVVATSHFTYPSMSCFILINLGLLFLVLVCRYCCSCMCSTLRACLCYSRDFCGVVHLAMFSLFVFVGSCFVDCAGCMGSFVFIWLYNFFTINYKLMISQKLI